MAIKEFFILCLLGISTCVTSNVCPPSEDIPDCKCLSYDQTLALSCKASKNLKSIEDYRKILLDNFDKKTSIGLRFEGFKEENKLSSRVFEDLNVVDLAFFHNPDISKWADYEGGPAFVGLEDSLEKILFQDSITTGSKDASQQEKAPMSLGHLRKLREADFHFNRIYTFANGWFDKGPNSLEVLKLNFCGMRSIDDRAFAALTNLKVISMHSNNIETLSRTMFPNPATHLEEIYASHNKLKTLPDDMFTSMPALDIVELSGNSISSLPENVWRPVWSRLRFLNLSGNDLKCNALSDWIFKVRIPKKLWGACVDDARNLETLDDFIENKQKEN